MTTTKVRIAPSILSADLMHLATELKKIENYADIIHIDIMDGHFVPNLTFGPALVSQVREYTNKIIDVHLMLSQPQNFIDKFLDAGTNFLSFHIEAKLDHEKWLDRIKDSGCKAGIVINPETKVDKIEHLLSCLDYVLVMTVHPGYGGQSYIDECTKKIEQLKQLKRNNHFSIEVDGGINLKTGKTAKEAGADILVAGSFIFKNKNNFQKTIKDLRNV